jgi:tetratricopeptide (TPR) repeat protein
MRVLPAILITELLLAGAGLAWQTRQQEVDDWTAEHFRLAREAHVRNDLDTAAREYAAIVSRNPKFAEVYVNLAIIYHQQKNYRAALPLLNTAVSLKPDMLGAQLFLGIDRYLTQNFKGAIAPLTKALQLSPSDRQAGLFLALVYLALEDPDKAARQLRATARYAPDDLDILFRQGEAYLDGIRQSLRVLAQGGRDSAMYHWALGISAEHKGDSAGAILEYLAALRLDPAVPELYRKLAQMLRSLGAGELANTALERYRMIAPDCQPEMQERAAAPSPAGPEQVELFRKAWRELPPAPGHAGPWAIGDSLANKAVAARLAKAGSERLREMLREYCRGNYSAVAQPMSSGAPKLPPDWVENYVLARAYVSASDPEAAQIVLEDRLIAHRDSPSVALLKLEIQSELAVRYFNAVVAKAPSSYLARLLLAKSHAAAGRTQEAIGAYQEAAQLAPERLGIHLAIGELYEEQLHWPEAVDEFKRELALAADNGLALAHLGHAYAEAQDPDNAIDVLNKLLALEPGDAMALSDLGKALAAKGEVKRAIQTYERALSADPGMNGVHYRLFQLYKKSGDSIRAEQHLKSFKAGEDGKQNRYQESMADLKAGGAARAQ